MKRWLARLRHDLVKHAAWRARDLAADMDGGAAARSSDVAALRSAVLELADAEGRPAGVMAVWRGLRAELDEELAGAAPAPLAAALDRFEAEVAEIEGRAVAMTGEVSQAASMCEAILRLEAAVDRLAEAAAHATGT